MYAYDFICVGAHTVCIFNISGSTHMEIMKQCYYVMFFPKKMPVTKISFFIPGPKICLLLSQYLS